MIVVSIELLLICWIHLWEGLKDLLDWLFTLWIWSCFSFFFFFYLFQKISHLRKPNQISFRTNLLNLLFIFSLYCCTDARVCLLYFSWRNRFVKANCYFIITLFYLLIENFLSLHIALYSNFNGITDNWKLNMKKYIFVGESCDHIAFLLLLRLYLYKERLCID